jgi:hypothetical protein
VSRRTPLACVFVAIVALSGCSGVLPGSATDSGTVTADTVATPADVEYPPGFSPTGVTQGAVVDRSLGVLREDSLVVVGLERFRPGAYADYRYAANATHARFQLTVHNGYSDISEWDVYTDSVAEYRRLGRNDQLSFESANRSIAESRATAARSVIAVLSRILRFGEFRASEVASTEGERRIRDELTGTVFENATDERGYLVVGGDGVVREAGMAYTRSGEPKRFTYAIVRRSAVRVEVPPWLPAAR